MKKINFKNKFKKFTDQWSPKVIAELNDYQFKLVKIQNDFIWHQHDDTDEVFIVIDARIHSTLFRQEDNRSTAPLHLMKHQDQQRNQILFHRRWHNSPPRLSAKFRSSCIYYLDAREPAPQSKSSPFGTPLV